MMNRDEIHRHSGGGRQLRTLHGAVLIALDAEARATERAGRSASLFYVLTIQAARTRRAGDVRKAARARLKAARMMLRVMHMRTEADLVHREWLAAIGAATPRAQERAARRANRARRRRFVARRDALAKVVLPTELGLAIPIGDVACVLLGAPEPRPQLTSDSSDRNSSCGSIAAGPASATDMPLAGSTSARARLRGI